MHHEIHEKTVTNIDADYLRGWNSFMFYSFMYYLMFVNKHAL